MLGNYLVASRVVLSSIELVSLIEGIACTLYGCYIHCSIVVDALCTRCKVVCPIPDEVTEFFFPIYLLLPAALGPGVYSASNRNEYQKQKEKVSVE
jgi:hypothetical protein